MSNSARVRREQRRLPDRMNSNKCVTEVTDAMKGVSPTFSGAVAWIRRHRDQLNTTLQLVRMYPNLIQDPCLDGLWDFFQELVRAEREGDENTTILKNDSHANHGTEDTEANFRVLPPTPMETNSSPAPCVYICSSQLDATDTQGINKIEMLLNALVPFAYVKLYRSSGEVTEDEDNDNKFVLSCTVFLFVLNEKTLSDKCCLDKLYLAAANDIPILMVRDPGYSLPDILPECITRMEPIVRDHSVQSSRSRHLMDNNTQILHSSQIGWKGQSSFDSDTGQQDSAPSRKMTPFSPTPSELEFTKTTLAHVITKCYAQSAVFSADFKENSLSNLYSALDEYIDGVSQHLVNLKVTTLLSPHVQSLCSSTVDYDKNIGLQTPNHTQNKARKLMDSDAPSKIRKSKTRNSTKSSSPDTTGTREFQDNSFPLQIKPLNVKNSTVHLPPIKGKRIDISPVISQQLRRGGRHLKEIVKRDSNDNISIDNFMSNDNYREPKETIYLLFPKPMSGKRDPEVIRWPPKTNENVQRNIEILSVNDSSDSLASFDDHLGDIPDISLLDSSSPELQ